MDFTRLYFFNLQIKLTQLKTIYVGLVNKTHVKKIVYVDKDRFLKLLYIVKTEIKKEKFNMFE